MWWLFDQAVDLFLVLMHAPFMALTGFAVMGVGIARVMPSGSVIRAVLLAVAVVGTVASGLAAAPRLIGGPAYYVAMPGR